MPLISLIRLLWPCAVGLEHVSIKMHQNCLSETPITITSADVLSLFFFFFLHVLSIHCAHRRPYPTQPRCPCTSAAPQQTSGTFAPEWQREERMEETGNRARPMGEAVFLVTRAGWGATCVRVRACTLLPHSNNLLLPSIMTLLA